MEISRLAGHPALRNLSPRQLEQLLPCAHEAHFADGAFIFHEGDAAKALYLLSSGCVALEQQIPNGLTVRMESLCAGDILGLSWLFPGSRWTLDARCVEPVQAFALEAECTRERMQGDQELAVALLTQVTRALYQRLTRVRLQRLDLYAAGGMK